MYACDFNGAISVKIDVYNQGITNIKLINVFIIFVVIMRI
jgi:hypothetical protein